MVFVAPLIIRNWGMFRVSPHSNLEILPSAVEKP